MSLTSKPGMFVSPAGDAALVQVTGLVDEHFMGFGAMTQGIKTLVLEVSGMTRMTSFGVRQWIKGIEALPKTITDLYLLGCPTFFVDQLNMVLNFGGPGKVLTAVAPYTCLSCGMESGEPVDVLTEKAALSKGGVPEKDCSRCGGKLEFDESPESYFSFVSKYAPSSLHPAAAQMLAQKGLYISIESSSDKPPKIIKLVHGPVTYFRIIGTIGALFKARPFLVGAEGEVVLDLADIERFDASGQREWRRLLKSLASQVPSVTLVDVPDAVLANAADAFTIARNIVVDSILVPYVCKDCGRGAAESHHLAALSWPPQFNDQVCSTCGGTMHGTLAAELLPALQKASNSVPEASAKLISNRKEVLSRAMTDANVAQAGDAASANLTADDMILGKYKIVKRLSAGGMAEVFLAKQVGIGGFEKPVALKRILRQLLESRHLAVDMFLNEAKIAGRLTHPNIVQVLDVGEVGGALYLAMEYIHGKDLRDVLKKTRANRIQLPIGAACYVVREIAQALHHAYWSTDMQGKQLAVVHRDVSPHNVMLGYDGTVKLLDFGVAMSSVTEHQKGMIAGKWSYMSPEHTTNQQLDHRSDLFSLGVIFYLLCTGAMPFSGAEPKEIFKKIRAGNYKPVRDLVPDVPEAIANLVASMLSPNPDERPQTGHDIVATLSEVTRAYGYESSGSSVTHLLTIFADEDAARTSGSMEAVSEASMTRKVAAGSGATQAQTENRDSGSMKAAISQGSASFSRPTALGIGIDMSVSLARRSNEFGSTRGETSSDAPAQASPTAPSTYQAPISAPPRPTPAARSSTFTIAVVAVVAIIIAITLFVLVGPQ